MRNTIHKTVLQITVLHDQPFEGTTLETLQYEVTDGEWLGGGMSVASTEIVKPADVAAECIKLGNDGTFFTWPDNDADYDDQGNLKAGCDHE